MISGLLAAPSAIGHEPVWLLLIKVVAVFIFLMAATILTIWAERRVVARMQQRLGPNRCGPFGILQSTADGVKLMLKEDIIPALADKPVFVLAPILAAIPAFLAFAVIPIGGTVTLWGHTTQLQIADLPVGVLFTLACTSFGVYGIILAGWSSGSTYPLLGGLRSAAQVISYEIAMGLSLVPVFLYAGTLKTSEIVSSQHDLWYCISLLPSFVIYVISMLGETNRAPFDLPEAEGELVGGFHTEYSSIKFAMFFLAEYINMVTVSALATTLFLGGGSPIPPLSNLDGGWWAALWFLLKVIGFLFFFIWVRGTLPRLRYDQFMAFGWKGLVPVGLVWIMLVATIRTVSAEGVERSNMLYIGGGVIVVVALIALFLPAPKDERKDQSESSSAQGSLVKETVGAR